MPRMFGVILLALSVCQISLAKDILHFICFNDKTDLLFESFSFMDMILIFFSHYFRLRFFLLCKTCAVSGGKRLLQHF